MHITIKDVAKLADVSPSTVSRVIAESSKISDATKERVFEAMKVLDYQPNIIARSLANRITYTLGLILPSKEEEVFDNPFFIQAMRGVSLYAQKKGYYIMYNYCKSEEDELITVQRFIDSKWVDGIILTTARLEDQCIALLKRREHPFVVIGRPADNYEDLLYVDNDNVEAMYKVVDTLIKQGHRRIAYVGGEHQFTVNRHRLRGYRMALEENGIVFDDQLVVEDEATEAKAYEGMKMLLTHAVPDAIVGTDDIIAHGAYQAAIDLGFSDMAVVGFNNTPLAHYKSPSMSSVDIKAEQLGLNAARLLISYLTKKKLDSKHLIIEAELIERESTLSFIKN